MHSEKDSADREQGHGIGHNGKDCMEKHILTPYIMEIKKTSLLTKNREIELSKKMEDYWENLSVILDSISFDSHGGTLLTTKNLKRKTFAPGPSPGDRQHNHCFTQNNNNQADTLIQQPDREDGSMKSRTSTREIFEIVDKIKGVMDRTEPIDTPRKSLKKCGTPPVNREKNRRKKKAVVPLSEGRRDVKRTIDHLLKGEEDFLEARSAMIKANLRLVISVARRYIGKGLSLSDLIQEGNIGLMKAVDRFDHRMGCRFSTYAAWWIKQSIMRALSNYSRTIRLPNHVVALSHKVFTAKKNLLQKSGSEPAPDEIAGVLNIPVQKVETILRAPINPLSLDSAPNDADVHFLDILADKQSRSLLDHLIIDDLREKIEGFLRKLPRQQEIIIRRRYGLNGDVPHTLEELAGEFSVSRERIRQIETIALKKLKDLAQEFLGSKHTG